ncbi:hypothetical protein [Microbacterium sp. NPDC058389]|uniref:hypothetical protein n=1 Tax=Microbacterium sp. NPDC058389 TaxID=3346475 RepID=UPI00365362B6
MTARTRPAGRYRDVIWFPATLVTVTIAAVLPLLWNAKHYFVDDSVNGAFGQWFHLGSEILSGRIPVLEPSVWSSGNLFAEGQWGFFNPLIILVSVASAIAHDAAVFTTIVKLIAILVGAAGTYALARELGAGPPFAMVAATATPFTGFTTFFDAPSWVTGLFAWALLPAFWTALLRFTRGRGGPLLPFVTGYLLVSIGYVHGTIALALVIAATLVTRVVRRDLRAARRLLFLGIALAAVALAVHVTSLLTASVTKRAGGSLYMDGFMTLDLSGMAMSPVSTALPQAAAWWWVGLTAPVPMAFLTILVPLMAFVRWRRLFRVSPRTVDIVVLTGVFLTFIMLPTVIGPLRYPTRMLPYLGLCVIVLLAVGLDRARRVTRARTAIAIAIVAAAAFLAWAQTPQLGKRFVASALITAAGIGVILLMPRVRRRALGAGAVALTVLAVLAFGMQQYLYPRSVWADQHVPTQVARLQTQLADAVGDTIVVGDPVPLADQPGIWDETLFANSWYVNPSPVVNRYQLLGFNGFNETVCLGYSGETCPELAERLFEVRSETGLTLADELAVSSVQIIKSDDTEQYLDAPPDGWHVADDGTYTQLWVRDDPVAPAGGVILAEPDTAVSDVETTPESIRLHVRNDSDEAARIVFSRLAWPGYTVQGATQAASADGFLLTVTVPAGYDGEVTAAFRPPGLTLSLLLIAASATGIVAWTIALAVIRRRRERAERPAHAEEALLGSR